MGHQGFDMCNIFSSMQMKSRGLRDVLLQRFFVLVLLFDQYLLNFIKNQRMYIFGNLKFSQDSNKVIRIIIFDSE